MSDNNEIIKQAASEIMCETVLTELQDSLDLACAHLEIDCELTTEQSRRIIFGMFRRFMSKHMDKLESDYFLDCGAIFFSYVPIDANTAPYTLKDDTDDNDISPYGDIAA